MQTKKKGGGGGGIKKNPTKNKLMNKTKASFLKFSNILDPLLYFYFSILDCTFKLLLMEITYT